MPRFRGTVQPATDRRDAGQEQMPRATLMVPGFVDCHVHYVQTAGGLANHGTRLLDRLERHPFFRPSRR